MKVWVWMSSSSDSTRLSRSAVFHLFRKVPQVIVKRWHSSATFHRLTETLLLHQQEHRPVSLSSVDSLKRRPVSLSTVKTDAVGILYNWFVCLSEDWNSNYSSVLIHLESRRSCSAARPPVGHRRSCGAETTMKEIPLRPRRVLGQTAGKSAEKFKNLKLRMKNGPNTDDGLERIYYFSCISLTKMHSRY